MFKDEASRMCVLYQVWINIYGLYGIRNWSLSEIFRSSVNKTGYTFAIQAKVYHLKLNTKRLSLSFLSVHNNLTQSLGHEIEENPKIISRLKYTHYSLFLKSCIRCISLNICFQSYFSCTQLSLGLLILLSRIIVINNGWYLYCYSKVIRCVFNLMCILYKGTFIVQYTTK